MISAFAVMIKILSAVPTRTAASGGSPERRNKMEKNLGKTVRLTVLETEVQR